eukprot:4323916-Prymnesium_polylepis.2
MAAADEERAELEAACEAQQKELSVRLSPFVVVVNLDPCSAPPLPVRLRRPRDARMTICAASFISPRDGLSTASRRGAPIAWTANRYLSGRRT